MVAPSTRSPSKRTLELSLQFDGIAGVPDGHYTMIIEARTPSGDDGIGFVTSQALRVTVANGQLQPERAAWDPPAENEAGNAGAGTVSPMQLDDPDDSVDAQTAVAALAALPNLRNEGITHTAYCGTSSLCSVVFYNTICNRGTSTAWSFAVGMKGWGTPDRKSVV